ncbi:MAG: hypothetical protein KDI42_11010 [Gammaproteobacteria bacterium]|nr:hypothetical protein [Gammaproteobacteria bacterium]
MLTLSPRHQTVIAIAAMVIMALTRSHHVAGLNWLPDATTALFFLAGVLLAPVWWVAVLLGEAVLIDWVAITWGGVSDFCVTPGYAALAIAYPVLWVAGRWFARGVGDGAAGLGRLLFAVLAGGVVAEVIASGSFYFLGGRFAEPTLAEFGARLIAYGPYSIQSLLLYVGAAVLAYVALKTVSSQHAGQPKA